ncbi:O-antigen ligase family protein [Vibrio sinaloensis]|uniref:O-antigen ligase family protein n=1 Tax=Photobacterium sp. (strain ATCC 43367) TaxID=379097 RepID=UPI002058835F|nr:O-antigen ligase family protein [Vibrio sinaloensis]UPQ88100.1 O-antigen ligase family protein [Vibrio sinaloensis]
MKNSPLILEKLFLFSPIIITFSVIFNFHDSKFLISRAIFLVVLYCLIFHRKDLAQEFKRKSTFFVVGIIACLYFFFMQYFNEGNSDLPRSMLFVLIYFFVVPTRNFSNDSLFYLAWLGCVSSGVLALYEVYALGEIRVGYRTVNPIPFSYYSGLSMLVMVGSFISSLSKDIDRVKLFFLLFALPLVLCAVVLSQTRATYLSLAIISLVFLTHFILKYPTKKNIFSVLAIVISVSTLLWQVDDVRIRVVDAFEQVQNLSHDNYYSSTGMRVKLWEAGLKISQDSLVFGHSKSNISQYSSVLIAEGLAPSYLKQFLVHPNPNFHNQFIQTLVDSGLIGVFFISTFILLPTVIASGRVTRLGMYISTYTAICLWFDSMFLYNHTVILYAFVALILYSNAANDTGKGEVS